MRNLLRSLILLFVRVVGWPAASRSRGQLEQCSAAPPRILLIRPDHLGDLVMTTPVVRALKTHLPEASLSMLVGPWSAEIVARTPDLDTVKTCAFPGFRRQGQGALEPYILLFSLAKQLRRGNYDLAINLRPDFWWGAALLYLARIPRRVGYAIAPGTPFLNVALPFQAPEHATLSCLKLVDAALHSLGASDLSIPLTPENYPQIFEPSDEEKAWVQQRLANVGISEQAPYVLIQPGSGAAVKLWRSAAWATVADTLRRQDSDLRIVFIGSPVERPLLDGIARETPAPVSLIFDATIGQLAALIQRSRLFMGVDSSGSHFAAAVGTPSIALFGPTDPKIFGPWGPSSRHRVITSTFRCPSCPAIPCGRLDISDADLSEHPCVRKIPEAQVLQAAEDLLRTANISH